MVNAALADRAAGFIEQLSHTHGHSGMPFVLESFQRQIVRALFGTVRKVGQRLLRQFLTAYISFARKNGKSELAAAIALYLLFADGEPGAEIYSAAADREQAAIVFNAAKQMIEQAPALRKRAKIIDSRNRIVIPSTNSVYRVLSAEAFSKHGLNAHGVIFDELHAQPNRELWDVLTTSGGAREQPLVVAITTAGFDEASICFEQYDYAKKVLSGEVKDPTFYACIHETPKDADWEDEKNWSLSNPGLDIFRSRDEMRVMAAKAKAVPALQNTFRRLYLNQWTQQAERFIDLQVWRRSAGEVYEEDLELEGGYAGLDLSSRQDLTAFVMVFPDADNCFDVLPRFWIPEANLHERSVRDRVPYEHWVESGLVMATPGDTVDYEIVLRQVVDDCHRFAIHEVAFDRWGAAHVVNQLQEHGISVVEFGQGYSSMSSPTKDLANLLTERRLRHGGNPVLEEHASNMNVAQDPAGNIKPVKPDRRKSGKRIDGMVGLIMGLDRALRNEGESPYESRGILTVGPPQ